MKNKTTITAAVFLIFGVQFSPGMALDDEFYYTLGGGEPISRSATNRPTTIEIGAGTGWNVDLMCGDFDMALSVEQQLKGIKGAFSDLMSGVISAATGAVASLPGLVLQKLNPKNQKYGGGYCCLVFHIQLPV